MKPTIEHPQSVAMATKPTTSHAPGVSSEMELLIRARYPVLYVVSWEEARVEQQLARIAQRRSKQLYSWSVTSGMRRIGGASSAPRSRGMADPIEALDQIIEHKEAAIYLLHDFHPFLRPPPAPCSNVPIIRKLREAARALSDSYKSIVICAPVLEMAPELEKDVTVIDFPLPTAAEIGTLLDRVAKDVSENTSMKVSLTETGRDSLVAAAGGLTLQEAENVFAKSLVADGTLDGDDVSTVFAEKQQIIRKSGILEYQEAPAGLDAVGGLDELKDWLKRRNAAFSKKARDFGLPSPRGALLVGVQGCGKSLCAKAISREWKMPLLRFDIGRVFSSLVGSSESNVRRAIAVAESVAPVVLWIDEIDKALAGTQGSANTDGGTASRVMSTLLTWMNEKEKPVFVLATANNISALPPELLRKGRLDEIFFVDLPNEEERRVILRIHLERRKRSPERFDLPALATASDGFSGAELEQAIISAMFDAFHQDRELTSEDVLSSIRQTVPLSRTMAERVASIRSWAQGRARFATRPPEVLDSNSARRLEV